MGLDVRRPLDHLLYDLFISVRVRVLFLRYLRHRNACYVIGPIGGLCADDAYSLHSPPCANFALKIPKYLSPPGSQVFGRLLLVFRMYILISN